MSTPREINRLYDACQVACDLIENGLPLNGETVAELRASLEAFDVNGWVRTEPPEIDPGAIGADILSALNDKDFPPRDATYSEASDFLEEHGVFQPEDLAWAKAHARLAVIHNKTMAVLAMEKD